MVTYNVAHQVEEMLDVQEKTRMLNWNRSQNLIYKVYDDKKEKSPELSL